MNGKVDLQLRFVIYPEDGFWFAHSLEFDIVAEGDDAQSAMVDVLKLCRTQIEFAVDQGDIKSLFHPAPAEFWAMYSRATPISNNNIKAGFLADDPWPESIDIDQVEARELELCA